MTHLRQGYGGQASPEHKTIEEVRSELSTALYKLALAAAVLGVDPTLSRKDFEEAVTTKRRARDHA